MRLTPQQETRIRVLSDTSLYEKALAFAGSQQEVLDYRQFGGQINGLLEFSRSWTELTRFVKHQKERNWEGQRQSYGGFYAALETALQQVQSLAKEQVSAGQTKAQERQELEFLAGLLAREFVQHVAAEMLWQKEVRGA